MNAKAQLQRLYEQHESDLAAYSWAFEDDRWAELIFCLLIQCSEREPEDIRSIVATLRSLSLLDVDKMIDLSDASHVNRVVFAYVLKQYDFPNNDVDRVCQLLAHLAIAIQANFGGRIQRYLRNHGEMMRDELNDLIDNTLLDETRAKQAISHWLQNALSLPISLNSQKLIDYCRNHDIDLQDLWRAADELGLNLALVDDLLEIGQLAESATIQREDVGKEDT